MSFLETVYNLAVHALRPLLPAFGAGSTKVSAAVEGRRMAADEIRRWAEQDRDSFRPLLWLHGASAGELAGAIPIVDVLRTRRPELQLLVTYSSPSAESVLPELAPDHAGFPPLETRAACREAIEAARPDALVFAKLDAWPALTGAAEEAGVPLGMVNATVRPSSSRLRGPGRQLLVPSYGRLDLVGAVSGDEVERLEQLGTRPECVRVTGDASFERALDRVDRARTHLSAEGPRLDPPPAGAVRMCAGSTWPEDERVLIAGAANTDVEMVIVPHEPNAPAVRRIRDLCLEHLGTEPRLWSETGGRARASESGPLRAPLIVDEVGFLAELYLECDVAWVGGGVGGEGLHSVVEPAAAGVPVLFGPVHDRWEATEMERRGVGLAVPPEDVAEILSALVAQPERLSEMGTGAREYVEGGRGATEASAALVLELLSSAD